MIPLFACHRKCPQTDKYLDKSDLFLLIIDNANFKYALLLAYLNIKCN